MCIQCLQVMCRRKVVTNFFWWWHKGRGHQQGCLRFLPPCYETAAQQSDWGCSSELLASDTGSAALVAPNFALEDIAESGKKQQQRKNTRESGVRERNPHDMLTKQQMLRGWFTTSSQHRDKMSVCSQTDQMAFQLMLTECLQQILITHAFAYDMKCVEGGWTSPSSGERTLQQLKFKSIHLHRFQLTNNMWLYAAALRWRHFNLRNFCRNTEKWVARSLATTE